MANRSTLIAFYKTAKSSVFAWSTARLQAWRNSRSTTPCLWLAGVMSIGIILQQWLRASTNVWIIALLITLGCAAVFWFMGQANRARWIAVLLVVELLGWYHTQQMISDDREPLLRLGTDAWEPVVFEAIVDGVPRWRPDLLNYRKEVKPDKDAPRSSWQTILEVSTTQVRDRSTWKPIRGRLTITVEGPVRNLLPGDQVRVYDCK